MINKSYIQQKSFKNFIKKELCDLKNHNYLCQANKN